MAKSLTFFSAATVVAALVLPGCARTQAEGPFAADARARSINRTPTEPLSPVDQPGAIDTTRIESQTDYSAGPSVQLKGNEKPKVVPLGVLGSSPRQTATVNPPLEQPSALIEQQVRSPSEPAPIDGSGATLPSTAATTTATRQGASKGEYLTIGGVVAEVNGQPIYADKVLAPLTPKLAAMAKQTDERQFRAAAANEIRLRIRDFIETELRFAAASRFLSDGEKQFASLLTEKWRQDQIALAGGSEELARRRFEERGDDFEEKVADQYRMSMIRLYIQKRILPRVQVSAADMRREYERSLAAKYSSRDRAKFRLIKIEPAKVGDPKVAADRAADLKQRASTEDFAKLAEFSTDPLLARNGGQLPTAKGDGFYDRGTFAIEEVEEAAWKLEPGQVSDVIDAGNALYLVKLEQKEVGKVSPFESEETQADIRETLRTRQFNEQLVKETEKLESDAIVRGDPDLDPSAMQTAVEIAMQRYQTWRNASARSSGTASTGSTLPNAPSTRAATTPAAAE